MLQFYYLVWVDPEASAQRGECVVQPLQRRRFLKAHGDHLTLFLNMEQAAAELRHLRQTNTTARLAIRAVAVDWASDDHRLLREGGKWYMPADLLVMDLESDSATDSVREAPVTPEPPTDTRRRVRLRR